MPLRLSAAENESVAQTRSIDLMRIKRFEVYEARDENDGLAVDSSWAKLTMERAINDDEDQWQEYSEPYYIRNVKTAGETVTVNGKPYTLNVGDHFSNTAAGVPDGIQDRRSDMKDALYAAFSAMGYNAGSVE